MKRRRGRELYFRLLGYVRPYRKQFAGGIAAMVLLALTEPAIPALLKPLLDGTFVNRDPFFMLWTPLLLVLLFFLRGLFSFASGMSMVWVGGMLVQDLRQAMFNRLLLLPTAFFDSSVTGILLARVTSNVSAVTNAATKALTVLVRDTLKIVGLLGYALYLNWRLALAIFLIGPPIAIAVRKFARRMRRSSRDAQNAVGHLTHVVEEAVQGHRVVKVFGGQAYEQRRFDQASNRVRRFQYKVHAANNASVPIVELLAATVMAGLIYAGTSLTGSEGMSIGEFVAFFTAIGLMMAPLKSLTSISQPIQSGLAAAEHVFEVIDETPESDTGTRDARRLVGRVTFEDVRFQYPTGAAEALRGISFEVPAGHTVALVGPSGSGKTTVASLLPRFYSHSAGRIAIDDVDIQEFSLRSLRANIALVSQDVVLFNDTVRANIAYGIVPPPPDEAVREAARAAYALEFIERMPAGFDTPIGEDGVLLSGGQRQRLAIARALAKRPDIYVFDDSFSALDFRTDARLRAALARELTTATVIIVAQRVGTILRADRIVVLDDGRIAGIGTHEELMRDCETYREIVLSQVTEEEVA
jgi:subfamily B ATP-binding cassette protein MsbA